MRAACASRRRQAGRRGPPCRGGRRRAAAVDAGRRSEESGLRGEQRDLLVDLAELLLGEGEGVGHRRAALLDGARGLVRGHCRVLTAPSSRWLSHQVPQLERGCSRVVAQPGGDRLGLLGEGESVADGLALQSAAPPSPRTRRRAAPGVAASRSSRAAPAGSREAASTSVLRASRRVAASRIRSLSVSMRVCSSWVCGSSVRSRACSFVAGSPCVRRSSACSFASRSWRFWRMSRSRSSSARRSSSFLRSRPSGSFCTTVCSVASSSVTCWSRETSSARSGTASRSAPRSAARRSGGKCTGKSSGEDRSCRW